MTIQLSAKELEHVAALMNVLAKLEEIRSHHMPVGTKRASVSNVRLKETMALAGLVVCRNTECGMKHLNLKEMMFMSTGEPLALFELKYVTPDGITKATTFLFGIRDGFPAMLRELETRYGDIVVHAE